MLPTPQVAEQAPEHTQAPATAVRPARPRGPTLWRPAITLGVIIALVVAGSAHRAVGSHHDGAAGNAAPAPLAAVVNGLPVTVAAYQRDLRMLSHAYSGPRAAADTPAGRTIARLLRDRAVQEAVAEVLIDYTAAQRGLVASDKDVAREIAAMTSAAGGPAAMRGQLASASMSTSDLRWVARHNLLRDKLAVILHDAAWLDHLVEHTTITYYVGDGAAGADAVPAIALGHPAPPFVAVDLQGRTVSLADLSGRAIVLEFWSSGCVDCQQELQLLLRFSRAHPQIAVVAIDHQDSPAIVRNYVQTNHLHGLTVWLDTTGQAYVDYTLSSPPASFFIDAHGFLRSYNFGALSGAASLETQAMHATQGTNNSY